MHFMGSCQNAFCRLHFKGNCQNAFCCLHFNRSCQKVFCCLHFKRSCQKVFCCLHVQGRWQSRSQLLRDLYDRACDAHADFHEFPSCSKLFQVVPSCSKLNTSTGTLCRLCLRRMTDVIVSVCIIVCIMCMYRHEAHYTSVLLVQPLMANLHAAAPGMCILNATNACRQVHCFHCECYM